MIMLEVIREGNVATYFKYIVWFYMLVDLLWLYEFIMYLYDNFN